MRNLEQIVAELKARTLTVVARRTGISRMTLLKIADGTTTKPSDKTLATLDDHFNKRLLDLSEEESAIVAKMCQGCCQRPAVAQIMSGNKRKVYRCQVCLDRRNTAGFTSAQRRSRSL